MSNEDIVYGKTPTNMWPNRQRRQPMSSSDTHSTESGVNDPKNKTQKAVLKDSKEFVNIDCLSVEEEEEYLYGDSQPLLDSTSGQTSGGDSPEIMIIEPQNETSGAEMGRYLSPISLKSKKWEKYMNIIWTEGVNEAKDSGHKSGGTAAQNPMNTNDISTAEGKVTQKAIKQEIIPSPGRDEKALKKEDKKQMTGIRTGSATNERQSESLQRRSVHSSDRSSNQRPMNRDSSPRRVHRRSSLVSPRRRELSPRRKSVSPRCKNRNRSRSPDKSRRSRSRERDRSSRRSRSPERRRNSRSPDPTKPKDKTAHSRCHSRWSPNWRPIDRESSSRVIPRVRSSQSPRQRPAVSTRVSVALRYKSYLRCRSIEQRRGRRSYSPDPKATGVDLRTRINQNRTNYSPIVLMPAQGFDLPFIPNPHLSGGQPIIGGLMSQMLTPFPQISAQNVMQMPPNPASNQSNSSAVRYMPFVMTSPQLMARTDSQSVEEWQT